MLLFCVGLGAYGLGLFTALFLIAWELERAQPRVGPWAPEWPESPYKFP